MRKHVTVNVATFGGRFRISRYSTNTGDRSSIASRTTRWMDEMNEPATNGGKEWAWKDISWQVLEALMPFLAEARAQTAWLDLTFQNSILPEISFHAGGRGRDGTLEKDDRSRFSLDYSRPWDARERAHFCTADLNWSMVKCLAQVKSTLTGDTNETRSRISNRPSSELRPREFASSFKTVPQFFLSPQWLCECFVCATLRWIESNDDAHYVCGHEIRIMFLSVPLGFLFHVRRKRIAC